MLEVLAEKLVLSGQLLISMLEELKRNAALSNFTALNSNNAQNDAANQERSAQLHAELAVLQQQLVAQQVRGTDVPGTQNVKRHIPCLFTAGRFDLSSLYVHMCRLRLSQEI